MNEYIAYNVDGITLVSSLGDNSIINGKVSVDMGMGSGSMGSGSDMGMGTEVPMDGGSVKNPLLSNWTFVIGITTVTLVISVGIGIMLAKRKIKKGFELYED